jgi:hypothetical protein
VREMCRSPSCSIFVDQTKPVTATQGFLTVSRPGEYTSASGSPAWQYFCSGAGASGATDSVGDGGGTRNVVESSVSPEGGIGEGPRGSDLQHTSTSIADAAQTQRNESRMTETYVLCEAVEFASHPHVTNGRIACEASRRCGTELCRILLGPE